MTLRYARGLLAVVAALVQAAPAASAGQLGSISFPNSGSPAAQAPFLDGVKFLHSFQFDEAGEAFREAQRLDPEFALAYWGEAMSDNHPLWAEQDLAAARKALERLAPTREGRLAKAKTPQETGLLEAVELLFYGPEDKLARDVAYAAAMARLHARFPDDHEVATFYALSLLGTVRPGDRGFRRQALAASIVQQVFVRNPQHPGAAHFLIHSFDDPDHAPLALPAARAYTKIAPAAPHALHMPSHIFVQRGMWPEVASSNQVAYEAAVALIERMNLPEGREDFHTLSWLAYAHEMMGRFDKARECLELARAAAERNASNPRVRSGYLSMKARYIIESQQWKVLPVAEPHGAGTQSAPAMPGMDHGYTGNVDVLLASGISAAKLGDLAAAEQAQAGLAAARQRAEAGPNPYRARPITILEQQVAASIALARGKAAAAAALLKEAADVELTLDPPSGPPDLIKPATEMYGELLLDLNRPAEAAAAFEQSLRRTPRRTPSLLGRARAAAKLGDLTNAKEHYTEVAQILADAPPELAARREAERFLKGSN